MRQRQVSNSSACGFASLIAYILGYPLAAVPLGQLEHNKRPFGLCIMAKANHEEKLLRFQAVYETAVAARPIPELDSVIPVAL